MSAARIVVVGAGLTGASAVEELRGRGHTGDITLIGAEPHPPYERPPLSKGLLLGADDPDSPFVHDRAWYADQQVTLRTGDAVTDIDLARRQVSVGGDDVDYDRLLLATGAQPRRLPDIDRSGAPVAYLRTIDDALALKERLSGNVLVVGAGWIGLEVASAARQGGAQVTVVETAALPLVTVLGPEVATIFADLHREHGVDLRLSTTVEGIDHSIDHSGGATEVRLSDGHRVTPDLVVVAVGVTPDQDLAERAGLATGNGVLVDAGLRTSDPHVYAAGDLAAHDHPVLGRRIRVEHWDNAIQQGRHAARVMLGDEEHYTRMPYFFTDQYDLGMEYVGSVGPEGYDDVVVRGDRAARVLTALWLRQDRVVAGMHLNDWDAIGPIRGLVGGRADDRVRDADLPLAEVVG